MRRVGTRKEVEREPKMDIKAFNKKRVILAIAFAPAFFCLITYPWHLHVIAQYQNEVLVACVAFASLVMYFNVPSLEEVQDYHDKMIKADREAYEADQDAK
jgi:hypothetical protein